MIEASHRDARFSLRHTFRARDLNHLSKYFHPTARFIRDPFRPHLGVGENNSTSDSPNSSLPRSSSSRNTASWQHLYSGQRRHFSSQDHREHHHICIDRKPLISQTEQSLPGKIEIPRIYDTREGSCQKLFDRVCKYGFVLVRGTPSSGKTILAHLFTNHVNNRRIQYPHERILAVYCNALNYKYDETGDSMDAFLKRMVPTATRNLLTYKQNTNAPDSHDNPISTLIIVIDEGQITYLDRSWWNQQKEVVFEQSPVKFVVFVSHGGGVPVVTSASTDLRLCPEQVIGIGRHTNSNLSLYFTEEEYRSAIRRWHEGLDLRLSIEAEDYIYNLTLGHPGASLSVLQYLEDVRFNRTCQTRCFC